MPEQFKIPERKSIQPETEDKPFQRISRRELIDAIRALQYELLTDLEKDIVEIVPENRNFDIELRESPGKGVEIILRHKKTGAEKNLNSFLPRGHRFVKDEEFIYRRSPIRKQIGFKEDKVKFRGFLLSLFHEIGHAHQKIEHNISRWESLKALWQAVSEFIKNISIEKEVQYTGGVKQTTYRITSLTAEEVLPGWFLDKLGAMEAKSERNAWAFALSALRKLEREGYNVFAGFENVSQIRAFIEYSLYTYDIAFFLRRLYSSNSREEDLVKLASQPIFWKRGKKYTKVVRPDKNTE